MRDIGTRPAPFNHVKSGVAYPPTRLAPAGGSRYSFLPSGAVGQSLPQPLVSYPTSGAGL